MPIHKSPKRRIKKSKKAMERNRAIHSAVKTAVKKVRSLKTKEEAVKGLQQALVMIDKAAQKGILHPNNAARKKSRLVRYVNRLP